MTARTIEARSIELPALQAASTPSTSATGTAKASVASASESVGSRRWPISVATGVLEKIETPRSPDSTAVLQRRN